MKAYRLYTSNHDIRLVNETIGYVVNGGIFIRTPLPDYTSWVHIEELQNNEPLIVLYNADSNLLIKSQKSPIISVQIIDVSGKMIETIRWNTEEYEKIINTSTIPKGLYMVKSVLSNSATCVKKWIKN